MKTQDQWRPKRIISSSLLKNLKIKLFKLKNNGSQTRLISLRNKILIWERPPCVKSLEPRNLSLSKKNWGLTLRFSLMKKRSDNLKLQKIILTLKWTSSMTYFIRTLISKRSLRMITSTSRMNLNRSWRSLRISLLD